ncbi:MAG: glycosyltransferase family 2 protein [Bacteroidia bacterium]|nr:glycosyltransferase family 2 protein [Bacteroidia bacterium]MDW8334673.1 glycosyltransferase family 2 protein [Bacteroidia bacterium]
MLVSVVIPVLNEEPNVEPLYRRLNAVFESLDVECEYIFVNDGSTDRTLEIVKSLRAQDSRVRYVDFSRNFGHQIAVSAGIDHARGDAVVIIDADLQDPPELIVPMLEKLRSGYEVVYAKRVKREGESWFKKSAAKIFYRLLRWLASVEIPVDTGDFRIISKEVADVLRAMPEKQKFIRGQISWIGFRQTYVSYEREARRAGQTKYPFRKMLRLALDGITGFSTVPLKLATVLGFLTAGLAFVLIVWVLILKAVGAPVEPGWASLMIVSLFLGGVQLICIGILGEYLGRVSDAVKNRPLYVVRQRSEPFFPPNGDNA